MARLQATKSYVVEEVARSIKKEMKHICSLKHNSTLRNSAKDKSQLKDEDQERDLRLFSWKRLYTEFKDNVPTLVKLVSSLLPKADETLVSFICGVIVKKRCKFMSLMQRAISVLLYGTGTYKEVL